MTVLFYVTVIRPLQGLEADIMQTKPLVPVLSVAGIFLPIFLTIAIWPVWGLWTLPYMFVWINGSVHSLFFLPGGKLGNFLYWALMVAIATTSHLIPHPGHEHAW